MSRRRRGIPEPDITPDAMLAFYRAIDFAPCPGAFAYVLGEDMHRWRAASGLPAPYPGPLRWFYAGETEDLLTRLGAHSRTYGWAAGGGRIAAVRVIPCRDRHQARVTQFALVDRLGLDNQKGTADYEAYRATVHQAARMDLPAHVTAREEAGRRRSSTPGDGERRAS